MLLLIYLWDFVLDIWYDKQDALNSTSLNEWIETLRTKFAHVAFANVKLSKMICMRCNKIFNFKKKFREHVREQHAKKFINNSFLSIDTVKSICEIEKKSIVIETFALQTSQKFDIFIAISKPKFEFIMIFDTISSLKNSYLFFNTLEIVSKSRENMSTQCFIMSSKSSSFQTFESKRQEIFAQKFFIIDAFFSNDTIKSKSFNLFLFFKRNCFICQIDVSSIQKHYLESFSCHEILRHKMKQQFTRHAHQREQKVLKQVELIEQETQKQVELIEQKTQKQIEIEKAINSSVSSICLNLSIATLKIVLKSMKNASNQKITCVRMICKFCKQNFNFNKKL